MSCTPPVRMRWLLDLEPDGYTGTITYTLWVDRDDEGFVANHDLSYWLLKR